jgi:hypothetical protein
MANLELSSQPKALLQKIGGYLPFNEAHTLTKTSRGVRDDIRSAFNKRRVKLQKMQWKTLSLPLGDDPDINEALLNRYGAATVEFTKEEEEAWIAAFNSNFNPPAPLTPEERKRVAAQYLPFHHDEVIPVIPHESDEQFIKRLTSEAYVRATTFTSGPLGYRNTYVAPFAIGRAPLSHYASASGDFVSFLRVFAVDGDRFTDRYNLVRQAVFGATYYDDIIPDDLLSRYMGPSLSVSSIPSQSEDHVRYRAIMQRANPPRIMLGEKSRMKRLMAAMMVLRFAPDNLRTNLYMPQISSCH